VTQSTGKAAGKLSGTELTAEGRNPVGYLGKAGNSYKVYYNEIVRSMQLSSPKMRGNFTGNMNTTTSKTSGYG
jgi:hypothetical protein